MTSNDFWRPPKWTPELSQYLAKKILMNWEPELEKIPGPVEQYPTCKGVAYGAKSHYERCLMPADWWHPKTDISYCDGCISRRMRENYCILWYQTRLQQICDLLPLLRVT